MRFNPEEIYSRIDTLPDRFGMDGIYGGGNTAIGHYETERVRGAWDEIEALHRIVYGQPLPGTCQRCHREAYEKMQGLTLQKLQFMAEQKARLKASVGTIQVFGTPISISNANLTDKLAAQLIQKNPKYRSMFEALPDNIDELVASVEPLDSSKPIYKNPEGFKKDNGASAKAAADTKQQTEGNGNDGANNPPTKKTVAELEGLKVVELQKLATDAQLPNAEWAKLKKQELINYLAGKV